jgi:hypothetical protein
MRRRLASALLLLAACASTPPRWEDLPLPTDSGLARFDAACRFLPEGMLSYSFWDSRLLRSGSANQPLVWVCGGADFREDAEDGVGVLVSVADYGTRHVGKDLLDENWEAVEPISGCPVWSRSVRYQSDIALGRWVAIVANRFVVGATSCELLARSLTLPGERGRLLAFLPDLKVDNDAANLVFCRPRPGDIPFMLVPAPDSPTILQRRAGSQAVQMFSLQPLPKGLDDAWFVDMTSGVRRAGHYHLTTLDFGEGADWCLLAFFGFRVFI